MPMSAEARTAQSERMKARHAANRVSPQVSEQKRAAVNKRWESVKENRAEWLVPFRELPTSEALAYLEDLRKVCEEAGEIINARINSSSLRKKCAFCGKSCDDKTLANGQVMPTYISVKDFRDKFGIWTKLFFCSASCDNGWVRKQGGHAGGTGQ